MIEVIRASGGFQLCKSGEEAVDRTITSLLISLRDEPKLPTADLRYIFLNHVAKQLTRLDAEGWMRSVTIGDITFKTGR